MARSIVTLTTDFGGSSGYVAQLKGSLLSRTRDVQIVDESGFKIGQEIAATPGQVVFRNRLLELIQYSPTTETVRRIPIVIVAPWINKYYVLDLDGKRSLIRYLVNQGFTVFVTSWKNPGPEMAEVWFMAGVCLSILGDVRGMIESTEAGLRINPDDFRARFNLGRAYNQVALELWAKSSSGDESDPRRRHSVFPTELGVPIPSARQHEQVRGQNKIQQPDAGQAQRVVQNIERQQGNEPHQRDEAPSLLFHSAHQPNQSLAGLRGDPIRRDIAGGHKGQRRP